MTLTTSWQMLGQAKLGNSYGDIYIRIYGRYISQDETNLTSKVQYQACGYYSGSTYILDQSANGNVSGTGATTQNFTRSSSFPSGETTLATIEGTVTHDSTTGAASITASARLNFPNWSWSATASGSADLPVIDVATLHLRVNNVWKKATPYVRVNNVWKKAKAYLRVNGSWKKGV